MNLDVKDRKLLYYLNLNARMSYTQLAKNVGLSKNSIKYRIERLQKEGVIQYFSSVVNLSSINNTTFTLLLKFNEDIYDQKEIIGYLKNHPYTIWAATLSGQWDIFSEIVCVDISHLQEIVHEIIIHFGPLLNTYELYFSNDTLRVEHLISHLYHDLQLEPVEIKERTDIIHNPDFIDRKILHLLGKNSILSYLDISRKLGLTLDIVRYRMKNLIKKGVLIKFFAEVNYLKLGYTEYFYKIRLKNVSQEKMQALRKSIQLNNNISYAFFDINSFNLIFICVFKNHEEIDHLSRRLRRDYGEIIENQEYLILKEHLLFNLFPQGLLENKKGNRGDFQSSAFRTIP